jgi:hypothetical protein
VKLTKTTGLFQPFGEGVAIGGEPEPAICGNDLLRNGVAWLTGQLKSHASQPVVYQRGVAKIALCATYAPKLLKIGDENGFRMEWTDMDFLISAADLKFSGQRVTPRRGDLITIATADGTETFQVFPFGGEAPWRWSDPHGYMLRVHTKRITEEAFV